MNDAQVEEFAKTLIDTKKNVKLCSVCGNFTETDPCKICQIRDKSIICVVKDARDVLALEKINEFKGVYHCLGGVLNPMDNIGPNDLRIKQLLNRLDAKVKEVIVATNPTVEGEATALYLAKLIKPLGIRVSCLAQGISLGSEIEYTDHATLSQALENRREI